MDSAMVDWQRAADMWQRAADTGIDNFPALDTRPTMDEAINELDGAIERLTRLRGYLDMRYGHGYGDGGHASAVVESNNLAAKVRKALGFTRYRLDIRF
jgi:hypothetical protein